MAGDQELSVIKIADRIETEADAYCFLENLRWHGEPVCPHCGSIAQHYFLTPKNGRSRTTSRGRQSQRRLWKCKDCRQPFSVLTGTIMHGTHISVRTWVMVFFELCANKNGLAAREVERKYSLSPKSAWFMLHRIREAMMREPARGLLDTKKKKLEDIGMKPAIIAEVFRRLPDEAQDFSKPERERWMALLLASLGVEYPTSLHDAPTVTGKVNTESGMDAPGLPGVNS